MVLPVKVCREVPLYESISFITEPFVEINIDLPSGENLSPVHSISLLSAKKTNNLGLILFSSIKVQSMTINFSDHKVKTQIYIENRQ